MSKQIDALKLALEALETELSIDWTNNDEFNASAEKMYEAITAIKEALAQPEQEPVAWLCKRKDGHFDVLTDKTCTKCFPVYAHPPSVTWGDQIGGIGFNEPMLNANYKVIATIAPQHPAISRKPLTHEQRFDLLTKFEPHKNKWEAPAILIDMVEAAHGFKE